MLRMLEIMFSLNHVACAGLFTGKREIIVMALGNGCRGAAALAWLYRARFAATAVGGIVHVFLQGPGAPAPGRLKENA